MLSIESIVCVFLFSCSTELLTKGEFENCPDFCQCYTAPEDGFGSNTAYSIICDPDKLTNKNVETFLKLNSIKPSINTLVLESKLAFEQLKTFNKLAVSNLVLKDIELSTVPVNELDYVIKGINGQSLKVLTILNVTFKEEFQFDDENIEYFDQIKAIYFKDGKLNNIKEKFSKLPGQNIVAATFENVGLIYINKNAFNSYTKLRMLTIIRNSIKDLTWMIDLNLPELWYLDLRHNQISSFPHELAEMKSLKVLKLGENKIRTINGNIIDLLMNKLNEFSFDKIPEINDRTGNTVSQEDYFYPTKDMSWIPDVLEKNTKYKKLPKFIFESLQQIKCIKTGYNQNAPCASLKKNQYNFKVSNELTTVHLVYDNIDKYKLLYQDQSVFLSGAAIPYEAHILQYPNLVLKYFDLVTVNGGNVIKLYIDNSQWFIEGIKYDEINPTQILEDFLSLAQEQNIFVIITIWKSTKVPIEELRNIIENSTEHDCFLDKLKNLATKLNKFRSLAAWELIDEPNKLVRLSKDLNQPCLDTSKIKYIGSGGVGIDIKLIQKFIAEQASLIHSIEPRKLVSISINEYDAIYGHQVDEGGFNHYQDNCLDLALDGRQLSDLYLDYYTLNVEDKIPLMNISLNAPKSIIVVSLTNNINIDEIFQANYAFHYDGLLGSYELGDEVYNAKINKGINNLRSCKNVIGPNDENAIFEIN